MSSDSSDTEAVGLQNILLDAAGYLSKLGNNLRLRAEKIQHKKLSNTHCVRKVTDKVLLICDLSKKSIDKVEEVVKDAILKNLKLEKSLNRRRNVNVYSGRVEKTVMRRVGKMTLRISEKVNLEHFMSCQVKAQALTLQELSKYPLYLQKHVRIEDHECGVRENISKNNLQGPLNPIDVQENEDVCIKNNSEESMKSASENNICDLTKSNSSDKECEYSDKSFNSNNEENTNKSTKYVDKERVKTVCDGTFNSENLSGNKSEYTKRKKFKKVKRNVFNSSTDSDDESASVKQKKNNPHSKFSKNKIISDSESDSKSTSDKSVSNVNLANVENEETQSKNNSPSCKSSSASEIRIEDNEVTQINSSASNINGSTSVVENKLAVSQAEEMTPLNENSVSKDSEQLLNQEVSTVQNNVSQVNETSQKTKHFSSLNCHLSSELSGNNKEIKLGSKNTNEENSNEAQVNDNSSKSQLSKNIEKYPKENEISDSKNNVTQSKNVASPQVTVNSELPISSNANETLVVEEPVLDMFDNSCSKDAPEPINKSSETDLNIEKNNHVSNQCGINNADSISSNIDLKCIKQFDKKIEMSEKALSIKRKLIISSDSDSDSDKINNSEKHDNISVDKNKTDEISEESVAAGEVTQDNTECNTEKVNDNLVQNTTVDSKTNNSEKRPLIKCIDLNKLLKSPFKEACTPSSVSTTDSTIRSNHLHKPKTVAKKNSTAKQSHLITSVKATVNNSKKTIKSYMAENLHRQESKNILDNFVPKPFQINIYKLAQFSEQFLKKHNLSSITKDGVVIFQLSTKHIQENYSAKIDLLNESSDSGGSPPKKKHCSGQILKQKRLESIKAKRLLLTNSSSSDEDTSKSLQLKKRLSKDELRKRMNEHKRKLLASSSSSESDIDLKFAEKKRATEDEKRCSSKEKSDGENCCTENGESISLEKNETEKSLSKEKQDESKKTSKANSISQVDGNDDSMTGSEREMGRTTRSKTGGSSEATGSDNDNGAVERLANLKNLQKTSKSRESKSNKKSKDSVKEDQMDENDVLLEADSKSSSDNEQTQGEESTAEEQNGGLTGAAATELAREDLLLEEDSGSQQSDNSNDNSEKNGDDKEVIKKKSRKGKSEKVVELGSSEEESESQEKTRRRRKKQELLSSDSEAGDSKRKTSEKDSDYGAESDESAQFKSTKRKAKSSDSDSAKSSDGAGKTKKKRRRIKQVKESDASGSDSDNEGKKHGRKNIRKVMGKNQLEEATKKAAREERERVARIAERQKLYNSTAFDESGKPDEVKLDKVVLDFDPETKEPLIQVDPGVVKKLKPHQANGIKFMWDACFESVKQIKKTPGSGCILAHCMGLGKTLQVVSLTHTLLAHRKLTGVRRVLVVCPLSTVLNWVNEFRMWISHANKNKSIDIYELSRYKQNSERSYQLKEWMETGGVCVLGYEMFRNLSADNPKKFRKKMLGIFQESLVNPGPDMVVCDEGHLLKNEKTSLSQSMNRVKTLRRIVLTGTPLQNNLKEYYCMVQFVKPNLLGKYNEYLNRFVNPITNGQYTNSTEHDIRVMKRRSHVLHKMLDGAVQRRDYGVLAPFLPPKHEYVMFITLTDIQIKLYQHYLDNYSRRQAQAGRSSGFLFPDFQALQRIWTHPRVLKANSERYEIAQQKKRDREQEEDSEGSIADFLNDESTPDETSEEEEESDVSEASDDSRKKSKKKNDKKATTSRSTRANPGEVLEPDPNAGEVETREENPTEWWIPHVEEAELEDMRHSNKLMLLFHILRECEAIGDKLLVFSQSLYSLDLIEYFLWKIDEATQAGKVEETLGGHVGSWSLGVDYFRLDGSSSCENRSTWCKNFNREDNPRARLFLISTRAGGLGINLVAANRVVIFDVSWNPSHDVQSIFRVYRFGQKKPCYIYRFLAMGTMEEKIYERQVTKQAISKRVIDEQQIDRHYTENDLAELYTFQPKPTEPRPVPLLPKDRLFAEMLKEHDKLIYRYHEHDSLLENKEEETLTEEERKAAWEDFENEKNRPPPAPFQPQGYMPHMNGMNNLMQQQLMIATMVNTLRKDYPNFSEQQIANLLSTMFYSDPSMMQKMRGMGGMMGGMVMGGGSNMAPTWQQQQQAQLQRIQAQQAALSGAAAGVKYYSGGLGSRDPVSMALQQKQQREMMLSSTQERLRDMLVHQSRPPVTSGEVVNLDDSE